MPWRRDFLNRDIIVDTFQRAQEKTRDLSNVVRDTGKDWNRGICAKAM